MKSYIYVNRKRIATNRKQGRRDPPLSVRDYKQIRQGHRVRIEGPSEVIYNPDKPICSGATAWIETHSPVHIEEE